MSDKPRIPLPQQIAEVGREIGLRRSVYPTFIARGKMTQEEADEHLARMEAAYSTLIWLRENREWVLSASPGDPIPSPSDAPTA